MTPFNRIKVATLELTNGVRVGVESVAQAQLIQEEGYRRYVGSERRLETCGGQPVIADSLCHKAATVMTERGPVDGTIVEGAI